MPGMALLDRRAKLAAQARAHRRWEDELLEAAAPGTLPDGSDRPEGSDYPLHHLTVNATADQLRRLDELTKEELVSAGFAEDGSSAIVASAATSQRYSTAERLALYRASREEARKAGLAQLSATTAVADSEVAFQANLDGGMIALLPDDPDALTVEGGEPPELLHLTLRYVATDAAALGDETRTTIHRAAAKAAEKRTGPLTLRVVGVGTLGGDDPQATVLFVQADDADNGVDILNETIESELAEFGEGEFPDRHDAFLPHITVGYGVDVATVQPMVGTEIQFSSGVTVVLAGEHTAHAWGGGSNPEEGDAAQTPETFVPAEQAVGRFVEGEGDPATVPETFEVDGTRWRGVLIVEGKDSGDGRFIQQGALGHRELPLPLMAMFRNPDGGMGHDAAELVGRIDRIWRDGDNIMGEGSFDEGSDLGREALRLVKEGFMRGVSADLDRVEIEFENEMGEDAGIEEMFDFDPGRMIVVEGRVMGATLTSFPAFEEAYIEVVAADAEPSEAIVAAGGKVPRAAQIRSYLPVQVVVADALVASGGSSIPARPPADWFKMPKLDGPTPVRVTDDGRVFGHVATFGSCHIGFGNRCVTVPRASQGYGNFTTGETVCADGSRVATGPLVVDTVHPDLKLQASDAAAFYAHTGAVAADVAVFEDRWGIVIAGAARPSATEAHLRAVRGGDVSPDWRRMDGRLEMVALLAVNNSGFKVRPQEALAASAGVEAPPRAKARLDVATGEIVALTTRGVDLAFEAATPGSPPSDLEQRLATLERREQARVKLAQLQKRRAN